MDKQGRIKGKFSIIDIAVIFLIIAAVAGFVMRFGTSVTKSVTSDVKFRYVIRVEGVRDYTVEALNKKGVVTDKRALEYVGDVVDVKTEDARMQSVLSNGEIKWTELPERYNCYITIEANGRESEDGYVLSDTTELSVGRTVELITKYVHTTGTIESVEIID